MILSTTNSIPGREISEIAGMVRSSTVRAIHVGRDFVAALKNLEGGENDLKRLLPKFAATYNWAHQTENMSFLCLSDVLSL